MNITPTGVVLLQELERFNKLLGRMERTLTQLRRALAGEIGMDAVLDNIAYSLFNGQLPEDWRKLAPQTCKQLGGWIDHLLVSIFEKLKEASLLSQFMFISQRRNQQYKYWSVSGEPLVIWISGLHIPESYLTALIQVACRKNNWPLDKSTLFTTVTQFSDPDDIEERPSSVSYTYLFKFTKRLKKNYTLLWTLKTIMSPKLYIIYIIPV